jgi:hypothetical protein
MAARKRKTLRRVTPCNCLFLFQPAVMTHLPGSSVVLDGPQAGNFPSDPPEWRGAALARLATAVVWCYGQMPRSSVTAATRPTART